MQSYEGESKKLLDLSSFLCLTHLELDVYLLMDNFEDPT